MGAYPSGPRHGLSLCAGGGGLDLGLMLAEPDFHTRCFVEWEEYPRQAIIAGQRAGYFAPAPIWDDLRTFDARPWAGRIDTLLAGYPCQPFSAAGKRLGEDDERHLWPEVARCARELGPGLEWIFLENVAGHVSLGLETVLRELWDMGFTPAAGLFSAGETGAAHERLRIFIVAHARRSERREDPIAGRVIDRDDAGREESPGRPAKSGHSRGGELGHAQGLGRREGRPEPELWRGRDAAAGAGGAMADADGRNTGAEREQRGREQRFQPPGRHAGGTGDAVRGELGDAMADASGPRLEWREQPESLGERHGTVAHGPAAQCGRPRVHPPGPADMAGWGEVLRHAPHLAPAVSLRDVKRAADHFAQMVARGELAEAAAESIVCRMADGLAARSRALRLLGNGVMPLQAALAWVTLAGAHGLEPIEWSNAKPARKNFKPAID